MPQVQIIEPTIRPQKQKIRVCAYARVSSNSDDQLNSFSAQVEYFTQLIQAHSDWEFIDIYADEGITGTRADKRDDFQRMMRDCRAGRIDRILVKSISRFGRNSADCIEAVRELKILGIAVAFEKEGNNTKLENLRKELQRYRDLNDYHEILDGSRLLLKIFEEQESILEFEPVAFRNMVIKVRIFSDTICFRLINGMELAERR